MSLTIFDLAIGIIGENTNTFDNFNFEFVYNI